MRRLRSPWLFLAAVLSLSAAPVLGGILPDFEAIHRANGDGTALEQVLPSNVAEGRGEIAVGGNHVYWTGGFLGCDIVCPEYLRRATLNGENLQDLLITQIGGIAPDVADGKLYLSPQSDCLPGCTSIVRTNLDGTSVEILFPAGFPESIAVHPAFGRVCWDDLGVDEDFMEGIVCATVGSTEVYVVVEDSDVEAVAIDASNDKLYWARSDAILRANLDGSSIEVLVVGLDDVKGLALDPAGGRMWWTEHDLGKIQRADLDGSNVQDVVQGLDAPTGIAFAEANDKIYWLSVGPQQPVPAAYWPAVLLLALVLLGTSSRLLARFASR